MSTFTPELLAPAGTLRNMRYALAYGADAVYAGQPRYSLRARNNDFDLDNLAIGITEAHAAGKKLFVASNLLPHNRKVDTYIADMEPVIALAPDALIMADPGLIMMVRERWPEMPVHLSVQANTVNYAAINFWKSIGISRVILSRELSLDEIEDIRQRCPDMELEVFVHGALCIAYSGRCLLSGYFNHRDPNQGTCTNACRWEYKLTPGQEDLSGDIHAAPARAMAGDMQRHPLADQVYLIEEGNRREAMPILEDELGTYIMNSKDLRAIEHIKRLTEIGIDSFKIEGRTKSHYYVARTAQVYRQAIDLAVAGKELNPDLIGDLDMLANRGYTDGFYMRHHSEAHQNYLFNASRPTRQQFVAEITGYDTQSKMAECLIKNKLRVGDRVELMLPSGNHHYVLDSMQDMDGEPMSEAAGGGYRVRLPVPVEDVQMGLMTRELDNAEQDQPADEIPVVSGRPA